MNVIYLNTANSKTHNHFAASTSNQIRQYKNDKWSISRLFCLSCGREKTESLRKCSVSKRAWLIAEVMGCAM